MKLGLLIYGRLETVSGGYLYDRKLVQHLQRQGDTVEIVSLPWRNYPRHLGDNFSVSLRRRLENAQVDVLLQDELNHPSLFWLNPRLRKTVRYPLVSIVHHLRCSEQRPAWQNHLYRLVERRYLASVDAFVLNSQATRRAVEESGVDLATCPHVIAYPAGDQFTPQLEAAEIALRAQQPGPLRLLYVGNLIPRKGLHILLEAIRRLPDHACTLTIIGSMQADPAYTRRVQRQAANHFEGRVHFCGSVTGAELANWLRNSHVLCVPSSYEGFGIVYLEGMGFGLPAIATTAGGAKELITSGQDGFLIPGGDAGALAEPLASLHGDRRRLLEMSLAARQRYLAHPTWEQTGERIREFLQTLLR
jgi:glycosyltransferase involved in cell wall biosynthesis